MAPPDNTWHGELRTTGKSALSPYKAIQAVIEKYKAANEPIPTTLLSNLSHLKTKDPYSEYVRKKLPKGHSPPSATQSKSTRGLSSSQSKPAKDSSSPSSLQSSTTSHASSPAALHRSLTPKLTLSSGLFSSDVAERNKVIVDFPNSDSSRENYILNEYDCRMKKHIAFQAASFELLIAKKDLNEVSNLVHQQRRFEERWPFRYSETTPSEDFYDENIFNVNVDVRELDMTETAKESQEVIQMLQILLQSVDTIKHR